MYKFDFWKFRGDVVADHSQHELGNLFDQSQSTIGKKLRGKSPIYMEEFCHWCNCLNLDPIDYIEVEGS